MFRAFLHVHGPRATVLVSRKQRLFWFAFFSCCFDANRLRTPYRAIKGYIESTDLPEQRFRHFTMIKHELCK